MIDKARNAVLGFVGLVLALISGAFALVGAAALGWWLWCLAFDGGLVKPIVICVAMFALAIGTRFLAQLDQYEYVPPPTKTVTTRRSSTGGPNNRKTTTQTTTRTTGGPK